MDHGCTDGEARPAEQSRGAGGGSPSLQGREQGWGRERLSSKAGVSEPGVVISTRVPWTGHVQDGLAVKPRLYDKYWFKRGK